MGGAGDAWDGREGGRRGGVGALGGGGKGLVQCEVEGGRGRGDYEEVTRAGSASCSFGVVWLVVRMVP